VLSEEEKRELKEMAASALVRDEFRLLRRLSLEHKRVDVDRFIQFLTAMSRLNPKPVPPRKFIEYTIVKL
jgi:hypothetical protein